jgi:molecular chaperone DnaJ
MLGNISRWFRSSRVLLARKDPYQILGVPRDATDADVKKAYFKLAKQYHPDINKASDAKEKFAEINSAYETIGNSEKRKMYDATGMSGDEQDFAKQQGGSPFEYGFNPFGGGGGFNAGGFGNFEEIFKDFEDLLGMGKQEKKSYRGEDVHLAVELPFIEAIKGGSRQVVFDRKSVCGTCNGSKVKPGTSPSKCMNCGGRGVVFFQRGPMNIQVTCQKCRGSGTIIKHFCTTCKGAGFAYSKVTEQINIPPGIFSGAKLRMTNKGHCSEGNGPPGDLRISVTVQEHPVFKREGNDIHSEVKLTIPQAVLGSVIDVETLQGAVELKVDPGTNNGDKKRLSNYGVQYENQRGHHYVTFNVTIPKSLTDKQRELFELLAKEEGSGVADSSGLFTKFKTFYKQ